MREILKILTVAAVTGFCVPAFCQDERIWSPDRTLYAEDRAGEKVGQGQERERFVIYTSAGQQLAIAHVWLVQPDGAYRAGIRGCESWGWVDNARLYCEGSINPHVGIYLVFDAKTGAELNEFAGIDFVWSPDKSSVANTCSKTGEFSAGLRALCVRRSRE